MTVETDRNTSILKLSWCQTAAGSTLQKCRVKRALNKNLFAMTNRSSSSYVLISRKMQFNSLMMSCIHFPYILIRSLLKDLDRFVLNLKVSGCTE